MKFTKFLPLSVIAAASSLILGALLFGLFVIFFIPAPTERQLTNLFLKPFSLQSDSLLAKAAIIYDPRTHEVLFSKNANASLPLASLTKLMTAEAVLGANAGSTRVIITQADLAPEGDWHLRVGDVLSLSDLIKFALVASSNDAMAAAAASIGSDYMTLMNQTASTLGLSHTLFLNSTGLDLNADTSGAYGSAMDVALLAAAFMRSYPHYFELTAKPSVSIQDGNRILSATSTSLTLQDIPGFIGAKTGYTDLAGGNLVAAFDVDLAHPLIAVVLGSTEEGRFSDMRTLINATRLTAQAGENTP